MSLVGYRWFESVLLIGLAGSSTYYFIHHALFIVFSFDLVGKTDVKRRYYRTFVSLGETVNILQDCLCH